jgi:hypothetical protein
LASKLLRASWIEFRAARAFNLVAVETELLAVELKGSEAPAIVAGRVHQEFNFGTHQGANVPIFLLLATPLLRQLLNIFGLLPI